MQGNSSSHHCLPVRLAFSRFLWAMAGFSVLLAPRLIPPPPPNPAKGAGEDPKAGAVAPPKLKGAELLALLLLPNGAGLGMEANGIDCPEA